MRALAGVPKNSPPSLKWVDRIIHPTRLDSVHFVDRDCHLLISGYPWWLASPGDPIDTDSPAAIVLGGIHHMSGTEGWIYKDPFEEDLEEFSIRPLADEDWFSGGFSRVYASAAVPDPYRLLATLYLSAEQLNCPFDPRTFVDDTNGGWQDFIWRTSRPVSFVCSVPDPVCDAICEELSRQKVKYTRQSVQDTRSSMLIARLWDGYVICETADVVFGGDLRNIYDKISAAISS